MMKHQQQKRDELSFSNNQNDQENKRKLLAKIKLKLPDGIHKLKIYEGDDLTKIAIDFAKQNDIRDDSIEFLIQNIREQIKKFQATKNLESHPTHQQQSPQSSDQSQKRGHDEYQDKQQDRYQDKQQDRYQDRYHDKYQDKYHDKYQDKYQDKRQYSQLAHDFQFSPPRDHQQLSKQMNQQRQQQQQLSGQDQRKIIDDVDYVAPHSSKQPKQEQSQQYQQNSADHYENWQKFIQENKSTRVQNYSSLSSSNKLKLNFDESRQGITISSQRDEIGNGASFTNKDSIYEKLYRDGLEKSKRRVEVAEQHKINQEKKELEGLTFHPSQSSLNRSRSISKINGNQSKIEDKVQIEMKLKNERIFQAQVVRDEQEMRDCTFKPYISEASKKIIGERSTSSNKIDIHEKLYLESITEEQRRYEENMQKFQILYPFSPDLGPNKHVQLKEKSQKEFVRRLLNEKFELEERKLKAQLHDQQKIDKNSGQQLYHPKINKNDPYYKKVSQKVDRQDQLLKQEIASARQRSQSPFNLKEQQRLGPERPYKQKWENQLRTPTSPLNYKVNAQTSKSPRSKSPNLSHLGYHQLSNTNRSPRMTNFSKSPNNHKPRNGNTKKNFKTKTSIIEDIPTHVYVFISKIFKSLDSDNDGIINSIKIDLQDVSADILEIIGIVLLDMEEQNQQLNLLQFAENIVQNNLILPLRQLCEGRSAPIVQPEKEDLIQGDYEKNRQLLMNKPKQISEDNSSDSNSQTNTNASSSDTQNLNNQYGFLTSRYKKLLLQNKNN